MGANALKFLKPLWQVLKADEGFHKDERKGRDQGRCTWGPEMEHCFGRQTQRQEAWVLRTVSMPVALSSLGTKHLEMHTIWGLGS